MVIPLSRNIDDLRRSFRSVARSLIAATAEKGVQMVPYFTLRTPAEQARLWRMTRGKSEIGAKVHELLNANALYIANVIEAVGPQFPGPGITSHVTNAVPGQSWHNWGEAMDCYLKVEGAVEWDGKHEGYAVYGTEAEELGLTWGGMWDVPNDPGHVQFPPMSPVEFCDDFAGLSSALERKYEGKLNA